MDGVGRHVLLASVDDFSLAKGFMAIYERYRPGFSINGRRYFINQWRERGPRLRLSMPLPINPSRHMLQQNLRDKSAVGFWSMALSGSIARNAMPSG